MMDWLISLGLTIAAYSYIMHCSYRCKHKAIRTNL